MNNANVRELYVWQRVRVTSVYLGTWANVRQTIDGNSDVIARLRNGDVFEVARLPERPVALPVRVSGVMGYVFSPFLEWEPAPAPLTDNTLIAQLQQQVKDLTDRVAKLEGRVDALNGALVIDHEGADEIVASLDTLKTIFTIDEVPPQAT